MASGYEKILYIWEDEQIVPSNAALLKKIIEQKCFGISHIYLEEKAHTAIANTAMALAELVKYNSSK